MVVLILLNLYGINCFTLVGSGFPRVEKKMKELCFQPPPLEFLSQFLIFYTHTFLFFYILYEWWRFNMRESIPTLVSRVDLSFPQGFFTTVSFVLLLWSTWQGKQSQHCVGMQLAIWEKRTNCIYILKQLSRWEQVLERIRVLCMYYEVGYMASLLYKY